MTTQEITAEDSLIEYPCRFPVKVTGTTSDVFRSEIIAIAERHDAQFNAGEVTERLSKNKNYLALTLYIWAIDRAQLDALYQELTAHEHVKWVM